MPIRSRAALASILLVVTCIVAGCQSAGPRRTHTHSRAVEMGYAALELKDLQGARAKFTEATRSVYAAQIRGQGYLGLARCDLAEHQHQSALASLERARSLLVGSPDTATVELLLAESYLNLEQYQRARLHLESAFPYQPEGYPRERCAYLLSLLHQRANSPQADLYRRVAGTREYPEYAAWRDRIIPVAPEPLPTPVPTQVAPAKRKPSKLVVRPRSSWSAQRTGKNVGAMGRLRRITIHHTGEASMPDFRSASDVKAYLKRLQKSHQKHKGWADLGYHYLIDRWGVVWEGRSLRYQGAHAGSPSTNAGNIGVALIGNFDIAKPPRAQLVSLQRFLEALRKKHSIRRGSVFTHQKLKQKAGLDFTDCPGRHLMNILPRLLAHSDSRIEPLLRGPFDEVASFEGDAAPEGDDTGEVNHRACACAHVARPSDSVVVEHSPRPQSDD